MKFLLVAGRNALYTYGKSGQAYEPVFIEGSEVFPLRAGALQEEIRSYLKILAGEKNLRIPERKADSQEEAYLQEKKNFEANLRFDVLESADGSCNQAVRNVLEAHIDRTYPLDDTLRIVMKRLAGDQKLMTDRYGINYEGCSYQRDKDRVVRDAFDLLAYTVHSRDVVDIMNW